MAGRLIIDPGGGSEATLTLGSTSAVERLAVENTTTHPRATYDAGANVQTEASVAPEMGRGTLLLRLTDAERQTVHGWMTSPGFLDGVALRAYRVVGGSYYDIVAEGDPYEERYEPLRIPKLYRLHLRVVISGSG